MARLVDADVMTDYLGDKFLEVQRALGVGFEHPRLVEILEMIQWVKRQPTVDAVKVTRCKDCEYWRGEGKYCDYDMSGLAEDYCSWGVRRAKDENSKKG